MYYDSDIHHRRSIRLKNYNYIEEGAYFLTICTKHKQCLFGDIKNSTVRLNKLGSIAYNCWQEIPHHFPHIELDISVIMPNHFHGILWITKSIDNQAQPRQFDKMKPGSISTIIRSYKAVVTKKINQISQQKGTSLIWQRNFYEYIIRDRKALDNIRQYILDNPLNWQDDENYSTSTDILFDLPF